MGGRAAAAEDALLRASTRFVAQRRGRAAEARIVALLPIPLVAQGRSHGKARTIAWTAHDDEFRLAIGH